MKVGVEIEGCYNGKIFPTIRGGGYGMSGGQPLNGFWLQTYDSSIEGSPFENTLRYEIIQKPISGYSNFKKSLQAFKELAEDSPLKDFVKFNKSCGCHWHFSSENPISRNMLFDTVVSFRKYFFEQLDNSSLPKSIIQDIKGAYGRSYSKEIGDESTFKLLKVESDKRYEFNFSSEKHGKGLEWRSFNLTNIETWEQFDEVMDIGYRSLEWLLDRVSKVKVDSSEIKIRLPKSKLKKAGKIIKCVI